MSLIDNYDYVLDLAPKLFKEFDCPPTTIVIQPDSTIYRMTQNPACCAIASMISINDLIPPEESNCQHERMFDIDFCYIAFNEYYLSKGTEEQLKKILAHEITHILDFYNMSFSFKHTKEQFELLKERGYLSYYDDTYEKFHELYDWKLIYDEQDLMSDCG